MNFNWLANILVHHPFLILTAIAVVSTTCLIIPFSLKTLPSFSDPQSGFETRGTLISNRVVSWKNLVDSIRESGPLTGNPKEYLNRFNYTSYHYRTRKRKNRKKHEERIYATTKIYADNVTDPRDSNWRDLKRLLDLSITGRRNGESFFDIFKKGFFCGPPNEAYAHVVLESKNGEDMFTLDKLQTLCRLEYELMQPRIYRELCVRTGPNKPNQCCRPWSLVNYIALIRNRPSCLAITEEDINLTKSLLQNCSVYFHNLNLTEDCAEKNNCKAPIYCVIHNAVFNIFNYLTAASYLPPNHMFKSKLQQTTIFIPLAGSTAILPYYHELERKRLDYGGISVVAMDFGIKNALFDEYLVRDTRLMTVGGFFVFICIWFFTDSLFLTIMTIIAIVFSLGISYFMYTLVFELRFFPFMNFLAAIITLGIGADDVFIFCKIWQTMKQNKDNSLVKTMTDTLDHALVSMLVTSVTTSAAFFASFISSVTAVRCFSLFASMTVIANSFLMILWFPACIVVWEQSISSWCEIFKSCIAALAHRWCFMSQWSFSAVCYMKCCNLDRLWNERDNLIIEIILKFRVIFVVILTSIALLSSYIVFYYPKMQLPNSPDFQLFQSSHPFEKYELMYKNSFWFSKTQRADPTIYNNLPMHFVWGVVPQDNGNYLEPQSFGSLVFDDTFNISYPESQIWLLNFCKQLKRQPFYKPTWDPLHTNCFIEWFVTWMRKPCNDTMEMRDRSPCCESESFPYRSWVFDYCIIEAIDDLYETPPMYFRPGVQGPKFSKDQNPTIKAVVVEFDSRYTFSMSYDYMHDFVSQVEKWFNKQMLTAPSTMQGGWFASDLEFYDLQRVLSYSTLGAIFISMGLSLIVLLFATFNVMISLFAIFNITCSIVVTMAILVLLGWKLNVLESVAISSAIGLTVDFSLHYTVNYKLAPANLLENRIAAAKHALSKMFQPVTMAALTTAIAGAFMMPSMILAYIQIGAFLVIVMCVSWLYSTFHLGALLALAGPRNNFGQCSLKWLKRGPKPTNANLRTRRAAIVDSHELDVLTENKNVEKPCSSKSLHRTSSGNKQNSNKYVVSDQSPSATSAITVIMADDN